MTLSVLPNWTSWRRPALCLAIVATLLSTGFTPVAAGASDCRWIFCGTVNSSKNSQDNILVGSNWSTSAGRPTGTTASVPPGGSSRATMKDADGYPLVRGVCAWFSGPGGTTQAKNYLRGDSAWHKIGDDFNFTLTTYKC